MQKLKRYAAVYTVGAIGYSCIEIVWRGFTHWSMSLTGGLCFSLLYGVNQRLRDIGFLMRGLAGSAIVTSVEFTVGCIVNLILGWHVWDYSDQKFHLLGQICLPYSILWFFLCLPIGVLCSPPGEPRGIRRLHRSV